MTEVTPPPEGVQAPLFSDEMRRHAEEALAGLGARRAEIEDRLARAQRELEFVTSEEASAQLVLDALDGKLVRTDDASRFEPAVDLGPGPGRERDTFEDEPPARAAWPEEHPPSPELIDRAHAFLTSVDDFSVEELNDALLRDEDAESTVHSHTADTLLTMFLTDGSVVIDHAATGEGSRNRYRFIATGELESDRSEEGGVQPKSETAPADEDEVATPDEPHPDGEIEEESTVEQHDDESKAAPVLPLTSGEDRMAVIDDAVADHLREYPRSTRQSVMDACTLTDTAASRSLTRLVRQERAMIVSENPTCWSLLPAEPEPEPDAATFPGAGAASVEQARAEEPEPKPEPAATTGGRQFRDPNQYLSLEIVRDHAKMYEAEHGEPWKKPELAKFMSDKLGREVKPASIQDYVKALSDSDVLTRTGGKRGPGVRFQYTKPNGGGPTHRPRHDHPRQAPKGVKTDADRGEAVPHTGRARGRSGKQGENKKKQALGFRVKSARGDRKRAG